MGTPKEDYQAQLIRRVRAGEQSASKAVGKLSTSEELTVLLGIGTPAALRILAKGRFPTIAEAWQRIDEPQRAIVLAAWGDAS